MIPIRENETIYGNNNNNNDNDDVVAFMDELKHEQKNERKIKHTQTQTQCIYINIKCKNE